jgi:hypothetical protein
VIVVPQVRHSNVRVMGALSCSMMLGITRARYIPFPHFGLVALWGLSSLWRKPLQEPRDLRGVPMTGAARGRDVTRVERRGDVAQARNPGSS